MKRVIEFVRRTAKRWPSWKGVGPRYEGMSRLDQRCERRMKRKYWRSERPRVVKRRKRRKWGKVVWLTQLLVQGQWWSILGMHLLHSLQ